MQAFCTTCDSVQEVEEVEDQTDIVFCTSCGDEFSLSDTPGKSDRQDTYDHYIVGSVVAVEPIPKQKDLKKALIDVSGDGNPDTLVQIVTNAKYIEVGWKVAVALEGAVVPAGAGEDGTKVSPTSVGGVKSYGMLCDSWMLGWTGGAKGMLVSLLSSAQVGEKPPSERPRGEN